MAAPATAATQKRWLTASTGKLSKVEDLKVGHDALHALVVRVNLTSVQRILSNEAAWDLLPQETQQRLYDLLPKVPEGRTHNSDVHPLKSPYKRHIEREIKWWHDDLKDGKETKAWRDDAMKAGQNRSAGLWDDWKEAHREETWGPRKDENEVIKEEKLETITNGQEVEDSEAGEDAIMS